MKNNLFVLTIACFIAASCAVNKMQPRTMEDYYAQTGIEKYFLQEIPSWANFDQNAGCFRRTGIRYFNIDALMKSYALSYEQSIQVQASFNEEYLRFKKSDKLKTLTVKEEELLFYKVSEKVSSKLYFFDPPQFQKINLVWLDEVLGDEKKIKRLKNLLKSPAMDVAQPVLVSFCMTRDEVEKVFPDLNTKMITAELFSIYTSQGAMTPGFVLELEQFFKPNQQLMFYSQKKFAPDEFIELKRTLKLINY
ncbi:MAG: hypothetical protein WC635_13505 [Bacteriovorax sp.]|jgi:hypothetical protein